MVDESVAVLDENGNPTKDVILKSLAHEKGIWHLTSHIWIYNSKGEVLLQKRAKIKNLYPGLWDISAAGHVGSNDTPDSAAVKEIAEELGLDVNITDLKKIGVRKKENSLIPPGWIAPHNEFIHLYILRFDGSINDLKLQVEEVESIKFIFLDKFESDVKDFELVKKYVPHGEHYLNIIKIIRNELSL